MDELYQLAFAFKKAKLWKKLWDSELFAVQLSDGEMGYCCVMGRGGAHFALAMYVGEYGLQSYCTIAQGPESADDVHSTEFFFSQDCVMCSFQCKEDLRPCEIEAVRAYCAANGITLRGANAWPQLQRYRPYYMPWTIQDELDKQRLKEALLAALEVAERLKSSTAAELGFFEGDAFDREIPLLIRTEDGYDWQKVMLPPLKLQSYPTLGLLYDLPLKRARTAKKTPNVWSCEVLLLPEPISSREDSGSSEDGYVVDPNEAPHYPWAQMVMDEDSGMILSHKICEEDEDYAEIFPNTMLDLIQKLGKPRKLLVKKWRTAALYQGFGEKVGINLEIVDECEELDAAVSELIANLMSNGLDRNKMEFEGDLWDEMKELLSSYSDFSLLPSEMLFLLGSIVDEAGDYLIDEGVISAKQRKLLEQEIEKRLR